MPMDGQVGGKSSTKQPMLTIESKNIVLKPLQSDNRGLREIVFYELIHLLGPANYNLRHKHKTAYTSAVAMKGTSTNKKRNQTSINIALKLIHNSLWFIIYGYKFRSWYRTMKQLCNLSPFFVEYYGFISDIDTCSPNEDTNDNQKQEDKCDNSDGSTCPVLQKKLLHNFIALKDERCKFRKPCIIDLKIGTETFEPDATKSKKKNQIEKYPQQQEFGFRIVGFRVYEPGRGFQSVDKIEGRNLKDRDSILHALRTFFKMDMGGEASPTSARSSTHGSGRSRLLYQRQMHIVNCFLIKLELLSGWFRKNKSFAFYSSSLLMIYEGEDPDITSNYSFDCVNLKMIDFAHVRKSHGLDVGYLHGIDNIVSIFRELCSG